MKAPKPIELDGRTGEGGGQLVRIGCALAAVTSQPIRITHVRGNREGPRGGPKGGGLKSQHVSSIAWLAKVTEAEVIGLAVGSHTLEFRPKLKPSDLQSRTITIAADSAAASTLLIFQAVFPFLLFAGNERGDPISIEISGGTNVSWSLSYEYLDQVLLPALEDFFTGIRVERTLKGRGWSQGRLQRGTIAFKIQPLRPGETLKPRDPDRVFTQDDFDVSDIDVSMVAPSDMHEALADALVQDLSDLFPGVDVNFKVSEESGADSRIYVLLVARSETLRWGRDILTAVPKKGKSGSGGGGGGSKGVKGGKASSGGVSVSVTDSVSRKVSKDLYEEVSNGGVVDEFLQDQVVIFQALAEGQTSFPHSAAQDDILEVKSVVAGLEDAVEKLKIEEGPRKDKAHEPFGEGSTHTTTARWVTTELLPQVAWYNKGRICKGVRMHIEKS
ncbi:RNA 3'-terminal phosphate cyclase-domain-containing protein [Lasiosphaeria hispida]|uniref:RNA 3'-terminal phosphate cyclase-domain-containing protein n=1 Tax=Lasiosphaeria hispida TaxID=260671 RepID=A0AAJ0HV12_9PEZI|nr:RNA 3'-terminal phosphate cyclase-domain-containing protein [Lasiosphaeria hispida]